MATNREKYGHNEMNMDDLEARIAADLYELHERLQANEPTKAIGSLMWRLMSQVREAYRTAKLILKDA